MAKKINQLIDQYISHEKNNRLDLFNRIDNTSILLDHSELSSLLDTIPDEALVCIASRFEGFIRTHRSKAILLKLEHRVTQFDVSKTKGGIFGREMMLNPLLAPQLNEVDPNYRAILYSYNKAKIKFLDVGDLKKEDEIFKIFNTNKLDCKNILIGLDKIDLFLTSRILPKLVNTFKNKGDSEIATALIEHIKMLKTNDVQINTAISKNINYAITAYHSPLVWKNISNILEILEELRLMHIQDPIRTECYDKIQRSFPENFSDTEVILDTLSKDDFAEILGCLDRALYKFPVKSVKEWIRKMDQKYPDLDVSGCWLDDFFIR